MVYSRSFNERTTVFWLFILDILWNSLFTCSFQSHHSFIFGDVCHCIWIHVLSNRDSKKLRLFTNCSVTKVCPSLCDPMDCCMPSSFVLHYLMIGGRIYPWFWKVAFGDRLLCQWLRWERMLLHFSSVFDITCDSGQITFLL